MTVLSFTVTFHSPFRVGSAYAGDGVAAAWDRHEPLPPDHLQGLMRAADADLLGPASDAVFQVFGSRRNASPWAWSSAQPGEPGWVFSFRHRVQIDTDRHSARKDHLVLGEQACPHQPPLQIRPLPPPHHPPLPPPALPLPCA